MSAILIEARIAFIHVRLACLRATLVVVQAAARRLRR
jgi:hypothetical protein